MVQFSGTPWNITNAHTGQRVAKLNSIILSIFNFVTFSLFTENEAKEIFWLWYRMGSSDPRQNIFFLFLGSKIWFSILCALAGMWALYTWWSLTRMCLPALVARNRPKTHIWLLYGYYWCRLRSFRGNHQNGLSGPFPSFLATCDPLDPCCDFFLGVFELCFHFKSLR